MSHSCGSDDSGAFYLWRFKELRRKWREEARYEEVEGDVDVDVVNLRLGDGAGIADQGCKKQNAKSGGYGFS
jgi:hypothetical protein